MWVTVGVGVLVNVGAPNGVLVGVFVGVGVSVTVGVAVGTGVSSVRYELQRSFISASE